MRAYLSFLPFGVAMLLAFSGTSCVSAKKFDYASGKQRAVPKGMDGRGSAPGTTATILVRTGTKTLDGDVAVPYVQLD